MERKDIELQYTWDLSSIYQNDQVFNNDVNKAKDLLNKCISYKGILSSSSSNYLAYLETQTTLSRLLNKLYCYAHLASDVEPDNQAHQQKLSEALTLFQQVSNELTFVDLEIIEHQEQIREYIKDPRLKNYVYTTNEVLRYIPHTLTKEMEELLSETNKISDVSSNVFSALRLEFDPVMVDGKEEFLNQGTLSIFLKNKDASVRKQAYENFFSKYKAFENVYANTLSGVMKKDAFYAKARKYQDSLEASLFHDDAPRKLFEKILEMANLKYRPLFHRYNALKRKVLKLDTMYNYDLSVPLVEENERKFEIEEAFSIILEAVTPLGQEYQAIIKKSKEERWIDFYPHVKKRSGAYSSGAYDTKPFILMNFVGDYSSLSTMIHELGHSCHSYLSNHNQPAETADYRIFVAEVASTVNEMLLMQYMMKNAKSKQEKASLLYELLEECVGLIFRQPMFADYEHKLHQAVENDQPLSSQNITELYNQLNQAYFGDDVVLHELAGVSCYYIPHFYYNYYVYKYTLGMCTSLAIANRIEKGDQEQVDNYLAFLKSGGSDSPIELLKKAGVDPTKDELYIDAFNYFESILNQFEEIITTI